MCPTLLHIGAFQLRSYAFFIALGGLFSFLFLKTRERQMGLVRVDEFWTLLNTVLFSGFIGARAASILLQLPMNSREFWSALFAVNRGFSVFGFVAGILAGVYLFCRFFKRDTARVFDYICAVIPLWQVFGRFGCFFRGCCYGLPAPSRLLWAFRFTNADSAVPHELLGVPLHPAQLYEAAGDALLAVLLYFILRRVEKGGLRPGSVCAAYCIGYGAIRFICEFFRAAVFPFRGVHVTLGQLFALALMLFGGALLLAVRRRRA
jgi:phosphatidylglycerol:prolipoprotein diacylglycerol transferase